MIRSTSNFSPPACLTGAALALVSTFLATPAAADGQYYAKLFGGASALQGSSAALNGVPGAASYGSGFLAGGAVGYDYAASPWRSEIEFAYRTGDADSLPGPVGSGGDYASTSLLLNGYYSFGGSGAWQPYLGAGLGYVTEVDFDATGGAEYSARGSLAWQVMAGAEYSLSERTSLYGELRYFRIEDSALSDAAGNTLDAPYETTDLNFGVMFRF